MNNDKTEKPLISHIAELRNIIIFCIAILVACVVVNMLFVVDLVLLYCIPQSINMIMLSLFDGVMVKIKIGILLGILESIPLISILAYVYIKQALVKKEQRTLFLGALWINFTTYIGCVVGCYAIFPSLAGYLMSVKIPNVQYHITIHSYVSTLVCTCIFTVLILQIPVVVSVIARIYGYDKIIKCRKYFILSSFIVGAIVTPPDPISQIIFALSCITIFELTVLFVKITRKRNS